MFTPKRLRDDSPKLCEAKGKPKPEPHTGTDRYTAPALVLKNKSLCGLNLSEYEYYWLVGSN